MVDLDRITADALKRFSEFVNRSHAQQLRRMVESWRRTK